MGGGFGFTLGRSDGFPTRYGDLHTPVYVDVVLSGIITAFVIFGIALLAIIPAYNLFSRKAFLFCRIFCSLFIGGVIVGCNYGHNWEEGVVEMSAPYKPGIADEIRGKLGLHIALRGINVTLKGEPFDLHHKDKENDDKYTSPLKGETINYNEHFSWEWAQGRFGFGKYAGRFSREFRAGVLKGLPLPILQVAEYFTFDGEGIRFGRHYRHAGWYSHLILWFAFGAWLISNILFCLVIRTAALFLFFSGCLQLAAVGVWTFVRNFVELQIPFQSADGHHDIILRTHFGLDYYLVLGNSIFCIILSGIITLLDDLKSDELCQLFGIDPLTIYDELLLSKEEIREEKRKMSILQGKVSDDIEMQNSGASTDPSGSPGNSNIDDLENRGDIFLRKRPNKASFLVRQSFKQIKPKIPRRRSPTAEQGNTRRHIREQRSLLGNSGYKSDSESDDGSSRFTHVLSPMPHGSAGFSENVPPPTPRRTK